MSDLSDPLTNALRSAPELATAPNLALSVANDPSSDPSGSAQAVAHAGNVNAQNQAIAQVSAKVGHPDLFHKTLGWLGSAVHDTATAPGIKQALDMAIMPLHEIQHQYRYLHDVEARHGAVAALLEGIPIVAGGVVGGFVGGPQGAALGAELVAGVEGRLVYKDSWARTTHGADYKGHYNRETGEYVGPAGEVSIGRDVSDSLNLKHKSAPFTITSAALDGITDIMLDPIALAGKLSAAAKSAEGAGGLIGTTISHAPQGDTLAVRASDLERVASLPTVNRAMEDIAGMSAAEVAVNYPKLSALSPQLGAASTSDDVVDVFRNALITNEMTTETLPSMTFTRVPFANMRRAMVAYEGPGSGSIRAVTTLLPTYFDKATLSLSNKQFNLGDPEAGLGVYRVMRYSQSHDASLAIANEFLNAVDNPAKQILIYKNGIRSMLIAKGIPEDAPFLTATVDEVAQRAMGGGDAVYGVNQAGRNISKVATENGSSSLGILASQQGKLAFPDFAAITRASRDLNSFTKYYGAADDWMYNKFTQGVFKKLVLLSGGFAQRIAAAETIPAVLREGVRNIVKSRLAASAAKDMGDEELGHLSAAVSKVMGGANKVLGDADKTEFVSNLMADNGGHIVAPAIDTTTPSAEVGSASERASRNIYNAYNQIPDKMKLGDKFGVFGKDNVQYVDAWGRWLSQVSNDPASQAAANAYIEAIRGGASSDSATRAGAGAAKAYWDEQPTNILNRHGRHYATPPGAEGVDPHQLWADAIIENVKGATHQPEDIGGLPNMELLKNVADGAQTDFAVLDKIPEELRPINVMGRQLIPDTNSIIDRIANVGFRKVLDPIINFISREPLYVNEAYRQYKYLKPMVDSGDMLAADARQLAQVRAVTGVLPFIHNTLERSQFSTLARNYMPFYFAQEQAYKRVGRLYADDPGAFRRFQLMISGLHEAGSTSTDPNGKSWLVYPGAGFLDKGVVSMLGGMGVPVAGSVPVSFSGQLKSLNTIFPFAEGVRPSFGPVVSIASHLIENLFPELTPGVHAVIGDQAASGSIYDQLIPNQFLKGVVQGLDPGMRSRSMQNGVMNTLQNFAYRQQQMDNEAKRPLPTTGLLHAGNIDIHNRPVVKNADGSISTVRTISISVDGQEIVIPTVSPDRKVLSDSDAIAMYKQTGQHLGVFDTAKNADTFAEALHKQQAAEYGDRLIPTSTDGPEWQKFIDRVKNQTRITFLFKAALGAVTPAAPITNIGDWGLRSEVRDLIKKKGVAEGLQEFLATHPDATPYTVFLSESNAGAPLPATTSGQEWINGHMDFLHAYPNAAAWFIPQIPGDFNQGVYAEQMAQHLRSHKTDTQVMNDMYIAAGNDQFYNRDLPAYRDALAKAQASGNKQQTAVIRTNFNNYVTNVLGPQNPTWWDDLNSADRDHNRQLAVQQMQKMVESGSMPDSPQTESIAGLLNDFQNYQLAKARATADPHTTQRQVKENWQAYLTETAAKEPNLQPVIRSIFMEL